MKVTSRDVLTGLAQCGPALHRRVGSIGASLMSWSSSPHRARMVSASVVRLARTVTSFPNQCTTGAKDQSEFIDVTTAPTCGNPSALSTPALIQC